MTDLLGTSRTTPLPSTYSSYKLPIVFSSFSAKAHDLRAKLDQTPYRAGPPDPPCTGPAPSALLQGLKSKTLGRRCLSNAVTLVQFLLRFPPIALHNFCLFITCQFPSAFNTTIVRPLLNQHNLDPNNWDEPSSSFQPFVHLQTVRTSYFQSAQRYRPSLFKQPY